MMLKKIIISFIFINTITGCSLLKEQSVKPKQEKVQEKIEQDYADPYLEEEPVNLGVYQNQSGTRTLITSFDSPLTVYQDIASFEVYYTKDTPLIGNQKNLWNIYFQNYENASVYKIGYHINFETTSGIIDKTILSPSDVESFFDYIQIYLYDDINQNSSSYSHITKEEITEETILTSIKLTASTKIDEVTTPITLTVFTYKNGDFDENNHYIGNSSYQIIINRK